jgi:hypothetical protein
MHLVMRRQKGIAKVAYGQETSTQRVKENEQDYSQE